MSLDDNAKTVTVDGDTVNLTPLEYDILRLLMQHPGKVFSPHEIYRRVWHEDPAADNPWPSTCGTSGRRSRSTPQSPGI